MDIGALTQTQTVGDYIAQYLADIGVEVMFGVISIHNMPILDAVARQNRIRFVAARGEAGAMNMADAYARVIGKLGVVITSTGTAAGNAAGAQVEALSAGSPVLHITTQVDTEFADRDRAAIHDVPRQPDMLKGISKAYYRMWDANNAIGALTAAVTSAISAPMGPVSLEIAVDVQRSPMQIQSKTYAPQPVLVQPNLAAVADIADRVKAAKRPLLWLGGGARGAEKQANELAKRGFGVVTSTNGRGVVSEDNPANLGAFNMTPDTQKIYDSCDLMIVVGSRLRGNETRNNKMPLPQPLIQIDADAFQGGRNYPIEIFAHGDAALTLQALLDLLPEKLDTDPNLAFDIASARAKGEGRLRETLGEYQSIAEALQARVFAGEHPFVRDVTISNSTFGNRYVKIATPRLGVHALGGGIGQGVSMGIGAAIASGVKKAVTLLGDGGTMLGLAELITAVDENANLVYVLMNDQAYGVIQNIQDAQYDSRRHYSKVAVPDFGKLCASIKMPHIKVINVDDFGAALDQALAMSGPVVLEVDMVAIGPFAQAFAGPPAGAAGNGGK